MDTPFNALGTFFSSVINNAANKSLYEQQYQDSIDFWNMQNKYNTPSAQASRMRQAGLNPDLQSIDGGNAASSPEVPKQEYSPIDLASAFDGAVSDTLSAISSIQDIRSNQLDNEMKQIQTVLGMDDFNLTQFSALIKDGETLPDAIKRIINSTDSGLGTIPGMSRRTNKLLSARLRHLAESPYGQSLILGKQNDLDKLRMDWRKNHADPMFSPGFDITEPMVEFMTELRNAEYAANKSKTSKGLYESDYYSGLDASAAADASNAGNERRSSEDVLHTVINRMFKKYVREGNFAGTCFAFRLWLRTSGQYNPSLGQVLGSSASSLANSIGSAFGGAFQRIPGVESGLFNLL